MLPIRCPIVGCKVVSKLGSAAARSGLCGGSRPLLENAVKGDQWLRGARLDILLNAPSGEHPLCSCLAAFTAAVKVFHSLKAVVGNRDITRLTVGHFPSL